MLLTKLSSRLNQAELVLWQKRCLFMLIVALPFHYLPQRWNLPVLGRNMAHWWLVLGLLLFACEKLLYPGQVCLRARYRKFLLIYLLWQLLSGCVGLATYSHNALLTINQIDRLPKLLALLESAGFKLDPLVAIKGWLLVRIFKLSVLETLETFGLSLWVYHLYQADWQACFYDLRKALMVLAGLCGFYSLFELLFFGGFAVGRSFLVCVNPQLYTPYESMGWWPPLFWDDNRLRSLCTEPSYFGIISALIVPFLLSYVLVEKSRLAAVFYVYFAFLVFMTYAKTSIILLVLENVLLCLSCWRWNCRGYRQKVMLIVLCSCLAYGSFLVPIQKGWVTLTAWRMQQDARGSGSSAKQPPPDRGAAGSAAQAPQGAAGQVKQPSDQAATDNKTAAARADGAESEHVPKKPAANASSNWERLYIIRSHIRIGLQHPVFGVGHTLLSAYVREEMPKDYSRSKEFRDAVNAFYEKGPLRSGFSTPNKFSQLFAETGGVGLVLFLLPLFYVLGKFWLLRQTLLQALIPELVCLLTAFAALIAALFSAADMMLGFYVLLGACLCVLQAIAGKGA